MNSLPTLPDVTGSKDIISTYISRTGNLQLIIQSANERIPCEVDAKILKVMQDNLQSARQAYDLYYKIHSIKRLWSKMVELTEKVLQQDWQSYASCSQKAGKTLSLLTAKLAVIAQKQTPSDDSRDILATIYQFLPIKNALLLSRVNHLFWAACQDHLAVRTEVQFEDAPRSFLANLKKCSNVRSLKLERCHCGPHLFELLTQYCPKLSKLKISHSRLEISDEGWQCFLNKIAIKQLELNNLSHVSASINYIQFTPAQLSMLFEKSRLTELNVHHVPFSGYPGDSMYGRNREFVKHLLKAPSAFKESLKCINLSDWSFFVPPFQFFQDYAKLENILLDPAQETKEVFDQIIRYIPSLKTLSIHNLPLFLDCIDQNHPFYSLEHLTIPLLHNQPCDLKSVANKLPNLKSLVVPFVMTSGSQEDPTDISHLLGLTKLERLKVSKLVIKKEVGIESLKTTLETYCKIKDWHVSLIEVEEGVDVSQLAFLFNHAAVKHLGLNLFDPQIRNSQEQILQSTMPSPFITSIPSINLMREDNEQLNILSQLFPHLRRLTIRGLTQSGLQHLKGLSNLHHLNITADQLNDSWLKKIVEQFPQLETLELKGSRMFSFSFSDSAIGELVKLEALSEVYFENCARSECKEILHRQRPLLKVQAF
jgi:hypothetical protein